MKIFRRIVLVILGVAVGYPLLLGLQIWQQSRDDELHSADAIVVLGAAQYDGRPSPVLKARLDHAAFLFDEGFSNVLIVTGGKQESDRFTEAKAGETYLSEEKGVPLDRILLEPEGRTTLASLERVKEMADGFGYSSVLLVSDPLHSKRIKTMAEDLGFEESYASWASYQSLNRSRATKAKELVYEVGSLLAYQLLDR